MEYTLKDIKTAYVVVSVLSKNKEIPDPLKKVLEETSLELKKWYDHLKEEKNVSSTSNKN